MPIITAERMDAIKRFIYRHGRLLERQLFAYYFGAGSKEACLRALAAYQNDDGGMGNGIEPDILCPASTAIGAETALCVLDWLQAVDSPIADGIISWAAQCLDSNGVIPHPPAGAPDFPCAPWWMGADDVRVIGIAGLLRRLGVSSHPLLDRIDRHVAEKQMPAELAFYDYPHLLYAMHTPHLPDRNNRIQAITAQLPALLEQAADHHPLFSRYWGYAAEYVAPDVLEREAHRFLDAIQADGGMRTPYPDLPWWRPIMTLDGLIQLKRHGYIQVLFATP